MVLKLTVGNEETLRKQQEAAAAAAAAAAPTPAQAPAPAPPTAQGQAVPDPATGAPPNAPAPAPAPVADPFANGADPFTAAIKTPVAAAAPTSTADPFANGADPFTAALNAPAPTATPGPTVDQTQASQQGAIGPDGKPTGLRLAQNMTQPEQLIGGFNNKLANVLSVPIAAVDKALATMGLDAFQNGKNAEPAIENLMRHLGVDARAMKDPTLINQMGSSVIDAGLWTAAAVGGATLLAAKTGIEAAPLIGRFITMLTKSPATTIATGAATGPGALAGGEALKGANVPNAATGFGVGYGIGRSTIGGPFGGLLGGLAGGTVGGITDYLGAPTVPGEIVGNVIGGGISSNLATKVGRTALTPFRFLGRSGALGRFGPAAAQVAPDALRPLEGDIQAPATYSVDQIAGDLAQVDAEVNHAIQSVPRTGPPAVWAGKVRDRVMQIQRIATMVENRMWARVPKQVSATSAMPVLTDFNKTLKQELVNGSPKSYPAKFVQEIEGLVRNTKPTIAPNGQVVKQGVPITVGRLIALRSDIETAIRAGKAAPSVDITPGLIGNWERLSGKVLETINAAAPGDVALQQALDYTKAKHDIFSRGPLGVLMQRTKQGGPVVNDAATVDALLKERGGPEAVAQASGAFLPGGKLASTAMKPVNTPLSQEFQNTVRTMYRETVPVGTPPEQAAAMTQKFFDTHMASMQTFSNLGDEMNTTTNQIAASLARKKAIETSALMKYSQRDASVSIKALFSSSNPTADAKALMKTFANDPAAHAGLKGGLIDELLGPGDLAATKLNTDRLATVLAPRSKMRGAFEAVFSPEEMARMDRIIKLGKELENIDNFKITRGIRGSLTVALRVFGAHTGKLFGHTIQSASIGANIGKAMAEKAFRIIPPRDFIRYAITDPKFERLLYTRVPQNTREVKAFNLNLRRVLAASEAGRQQLFNGQ